MSPLPVLQEVRTSNMVTFRKCERKAFLEVVAKEMREVGQHFDFGTITHKMLENWLKRAEPPPADNWHAANWAAINFQQDPDFAKKIGDVPSIATVLEAAAVARKGLHLLPTPGPGLVVEEPFEVILPSGVKFKSHGIDLYDARPSTYFRLLDHKTCKNLRFVPTPEEQRDNVQLISYGHELVRRFPDWGTMLHTRWIYYPRSNDAAVAVDCDMPLYELREKWAGIVADVARFAAYAEQLGDKPDGWKDVTPNYDHCDDYGGCQFRSRCNAAGFSYANWQEETDMGLMDRARSGEVVGQSVSAPVPQALPQQQPAQGGASLFQKKGLSQQLTASVQPTPTPTQPPTQTQSILPPQPQTPPAQQLQSLLAGTGVGEAEDSDEGEELDEGGELVGQVFPPNAGADLTDAQRLAVPPQFVGGVLPPDAAPASATPPEPKKRGKGKKASQGGDLSAPGMAEALAQDQAKLEALGAFGDKPTIQNPTVEIDPTPPEAKTPSRERASIVAKLRKWGEELAGEQNLTAADQSLILFVAANKIERGEL